MRRVSKKRAARNRQVKPFRDGLKASVGHCEICGHDPRRTRLGAVAWALDVHEIPNGANREKALDKPFAVLVVCRWCHMEKLSNAAEWPKARQLAALKASRPGDYDLLAYNRLVGQQRHYIAEEEVAKWLTA